MPVPSSSSFPNATPPSAPTPPQLEGLFESVRRPLLSTEVARQLVERILDGRLPASTPLSEVELARRLGVSRTPLHAAMVSLARDGLVSSLGKRGWVVRALSVAEARELFSVAGALEGLAVAQRSCSWQMDELLSASALLATRGLAATERFDLESDWHRLVLAGCSNATLVDVLQPILVRSRRYEKLSLLRGWNLTFGELPGVVACLARGEERAAARALEIHWRDRGESLARWIAGAAPAVA